MAEVLATLLVSLAVASHAREIDAEFERHDLRDLDVQALAHLGAAVVGQHEPSV